MAATMTELNQLVSRYSGSVRTRLTYKEFLQLILPYNSTLRSLSVRRATYEVSKHERLSPGVEYSLAKLLKAEIDANNKLETYRISLKTRYDFDSFTAFKAIDQKHEGCVNEENVWRFMKLAGYTVYGNVPELFIRRLDRDMDGKLSYSEFEEGIMPYYSSSKSWLRERYPMTEKKSPRRLYAISPEPQTEPRMTRTWRDISKERFEKPAEYYTPTKSTIASTYVSPYKSVLKTHKELSSTMPVYKKLEYSYLPETKEKLSPKKRIAEEELLSTIRSQARIEKRLEDYKVDLALQPDFNLMDGFRMFDPEGKCYTTFVDFREGLRNLGVYQDREDVEMLFTRYDRDYDSKLKYSDFCEMMLPKDPHYSRLLSNREPSGRFSPEFSSKTRLLFKMLLDLSVELERAGEKLRQNLRKNPYFDVYDAFQTFDSYGKGYVSLSGLKDFLENNGIYISETELLGLFDRYDSNKDGRITVSEFVNELTPKKVY